MAITHTFKGSKGGGRYGYYAYIEDGLLVVGEDWPREGGTIYKGSYENAFDVLALLKKKEPKLYNSITEYYKENPETDVLDPADWITEKLKEDLLALAKKYEVISGQEYVSALRANTTTEQAEHGNAYEFNRKMSETYRMMALRAREYANQFKVA